MRDFKEEAKVMARLRYFPALFYIFMYLVDLT